MKFDPKKKLNTSQVVDRRGEYLVVAPSGASSWILGEKPENERRRNNPKPLPKRLPGQPPGSKWPKPLPWPETHDSHAQKIVNTHRKKMGLK